MEQPKISISLKWVSQVFPPHQEEILNWVDDPDPRKAKQAWNTRQYQWIPSDSNWRFEEYWQNKMDLQRAEMAGKKAAPEPTPILAEANQRPLEYYLDWWATHNQHTRTG